MFSSAPTRPRIVRWRDWLPLAILIIALASAVALGGDRGYFHRWDGSHNQITAKNLAIAENMSPKHNFRLATAIRRDEDGGFRYNLYGRFPIGGYALIKLAISPFGNDLAAKLLAARFLMLLIFCGAAIFAYLAIARIAGSRWIALAATLFAFSSLYPLYYADSVAGESVMDLFGAALVFHGMAMFVQEGRFRQLIVKTCAALLLGWHVYALIMPFALWGFGGDAFAPVRSALASGGGVRTAARAAFPALARSRFAALAAAAILFGSALLALNFANEYAAYGGNRSLLNLPSLNSMMSRLGIRGGYQDHPDAAPGNFLRQTLHRAGVASAPYAVMGFAASDSPPLAASPTDFGWAAWGVAASIAAIAALAVVPRRFRAPMACLVLMGFCWALAARYSVFVGFHSHEGLFYAGLPIALALAALIGARRLLGARRGGAVAIGAAALAASIFALSSLQAARITPDADAAKRAKEIIADMSAIREIASEKSVAVSTDAARMGNDYGRAIHAMNYYLAGSYLGNNGAEADYAVSRYRDESFDLLTPGNRRLFLYERADLAELRRAERRRIESSPPDAESFFDVYLADGKLAYLRYPCVREDAAGGGRNFFLRLDPVGANGASEHRYSLFPFSHYGAIFGGVCMMSVDLPDYPIAAIQTGQRGAENELLWVAAVAPPQSAETRDFYAERYESIQSAAPAARSGFDIYLDADGGTLSYLKEPCSEEDARGRFFLSVHPADAAALPAERREAGHESLNFDFFPPNGVIFDGKCMATIQLPDYEIAKIETGQDALGAGKLWEAVIAPPPSAERIAAYENAYQTIASGEPTAQSEFDIYLDADGGALSYLKEPCSESDARGRFFLSVHPIEIGDLPAERRELGHESLSFDFYPPLGAVFNGKCMATIQLPDYEIAKIETGQDAPDAGRLWQAEIAVGE